MCGDSEQVSPAPRIGDSYFEDCDPVYRFKVIVQTKNIGGTKLMRGVVTAYREKKP